MIETTDGAAPPASGRSPAVAWWLAERLAWKLDVYRVGVGLVLLRYFVGLGRSALVLLGRDGWLDPTIQGAAAGHPLTVAIAGMGHLGLVGWFGVAVGLCVSLTVGLFPRACGAALFVLTVAVSRALAVVSTADDVLVAFALFWLALLPVGRTLAVRRITSRPEWSRLRVPGWATSVFLVQVLCLHYDVRFWRDFDLAWQDRPGALAALWLAPACLVFPSVVCNRIGVAIAVAIHGSLYLLSGGGAAHGILLASCVLLWGEPAAEPSEERARRPFDLAAALGTTFAFIRITYSVGELDPRGDLRATSGRLLADAGLLPAASGQKLPVRPWHLVVEKESPPLSPHPVDALDTSDSRVQLLIRYLEPGSAAATPELVTTLLRRLAAGACAAGGLSGPAFLALDRGEERARVAWIDCGASSNAPAVVMLAPTISDAVPN